MKQVVKLSEENVKNIIKESVKRVLNEMVGEKLPYTIKSFDKSRADEYSDLDKLIIELYPLYMVLLKDYFRYNEQPKNNFRTLSAANMMLKILNNYFEGDYFEIIRGGADAIITNSGWFEGNYDMQDEWCNYSIQVKNGAPDDVDEELAEIANALTYGTLPDAIIHNKSIDRKADEEERAKNGGLKVLGKIQLRPEDLNKKRW